MRFSAIIVSASCALLLPVACASPGTSQADTGSSSLIETLRSQVGDSQLRTYTAQYSFDGGHTATLSHEADPRRVAYEFESGLFVSTDSAAFVCRDEVPDSCSESASSGVTEPDASTLEDLEATGFVTAASIVDKVGELSADPDSRVESSTKSVAGENSTCVGFAAEAGEEAPEEFQACITDTGVLASFTGTLDDDETVSLSMSSYSDGVDSELFDEVIDD